MIRTMYNIAEQKSTNIIKCNQNDNIQRVGVLTFEQEKRMILRAGQVTRNAIEKESKITEKEIVEMKREKEVLDVIDEKRRLDKQIKQNTERYKQLSEENKELYKKLKETEKVKDTVKDTADNTTKE